MARVKLILEKELKHTYVAIEFVASNSVLPARTRMQLALGLPVEVNITDDQLHALKGLTLLENVKLEIRDA